MGPQVTDARFPGRAQLGTVVEAMALSVLVAGAVILAVVAFPGERPAGAGDDRGPSEGVEAVVIPAAAKRHLVVLLESEERATALHDWRELHPLLDSHSFAGVEFAGLIHQAALEEAITYADVVCPYQNCAPLTVLDLRAPRSQ